MFQRQEEYGASPTLRGFGDPAPYVCKAITNCPKARGMMHDGNG